MKKHRILPRPSRACIRTTSATPNERTARNRKSTKSSAGLTGYSQQALTDQIRQGKDFETFFGEAPALNPNAGKITGVVWGVRIDEIEDPLMRKIRYLDKLVD